VPGASYTAWHISVRVDSIRSCPFGHNSGYVEQAGIGVDIHGETWLEWRMAAWAVGGATPFLLERVPRVCTTVFRPGVDYLTAPDLVILRGQVGVDLHGYGERRWNGACPRARPCQATGSEAWGEAAPVWRAASSRQEMNR
jgi:hypothetical protein